jgi:hypothetical protein
MQCGTRHTVSTGPTIILTIIPYAMWNSACRVHGTDLGVHKTSQVVGSVHPSSSQIPAVVPRLVPGGVPEQAEVAVDVSVAIPAHARLVCTGYVPVTVVSAH